MPLLLLLGQMAAKAAEAARVSIRRARKEVKLLKRPNKQYIGAKSGPCKGVADEAI